MKTLLFLSLLFLSLSSSSATNNITEILASHPDFSTFSSLCTQTGVASQIFSRSTVTVLAVPNSVLDPLVKGSSLSASVLYLIVSYHVLLDYFDIDKFKAITNGTTLSTTLLQTSGQAIGNEGFLNITSKGGTIRLGKADKGAVLPAVVESQIYKAPYNISVVSISTVLVPDGVGAPEPAPAPVNFTEILIQSKNYNTFLSLVKQTGVDALLSKHDTPPGLTIFAPDDAAFNKLPAGALGNLTSAERVSLLEYHCVGTFFSTQDLGVLHSTQVTLASGSGGDNYVYVSISLTKGGATVIDTGFNKVAVGPTLYSQEPLGLYGISTILMPTEIFGMAPTGAPAPTPMMSPTPAPSPVPAMAPSSAPTPGPSSGPATAESPPAPPTRTAGPAAGENGSHMSARISVGLVVCLIHLSLACLISF